MELDKRDTQQTSALHHNIDNKRDISYYYAHANRATGEQPAAAPVHRVIQVETHTPEERYAPIHTCQFLDDGEFAKVYLPIEHLETITQEDISAVFTEDSVCVRIVGLGMLPREFKIAKLHGKILPQESSAKKLKTKVLIKLKKVKERKEKVKDFTSHASKDELLTQNEVESDEFSIDTACKGAENGKKVGNVATGKCQVRGAVDAAGYAEASNMSEGRESAEAEYTEITPHWYKLRAD